MIFPDDFPAISVGFQYSDPEFYLART